MANKKRIYYPAAVSQIATEIRKGAVLIAASIRAARKIAACEGRPSAGTGERHRGRNLMAEKILARIDRQ